MEKTPDDIEDRLKGAEDEIEQNLSNLHVSHDAAHTIAEDEVLRGIPAPSSAAVDAERAARARGEEPGKP